MAYAPTATRPTLPVGRTLTPDVAAAVLAYHRSEAEAELARVVAHLAARGIAPTEATVWTPAKMVGDDGRGPRDPEEGVVCLAHVVYPDRFGAPARVGVYLWWDLGLVSANEDLSPRQALTGKPGRG
jgi:hypothetical protein